jgi:hypothetical protein
MYCRCAPGSLRIRCCTGKHTGGRWGVGAKATFDGLQQGMQSTLRSVWWHVGTMQIASCLSQAVLVCKPCH